MKTYHPNFKDKRVAARARKAIGFAKAVISEDKPHSWSTRYLDKYFGQQQHPLSQYLRRVLLITTNNHWSIDNKTCKEYILNAEGYRFLRDSLDGKTTLTWKEYRKSGEQDEAGASADKDPTCITSLFNPEAAYDYKIVNEWCRREFSEELANLAFSYDDKSNRLWHPLQHVKRENKRQVLAEAGLVHQYDVDCCAPTLLLQYAQTVGMDLWLEHLNEYLNNKTAIRNQIAEETEIPVKSVKVIINALFNGARIGSSPRQQISPLIQFEKARAEFLRTHEFIAGLRKDIKTCWDYIEEHHGRRYQVLKNGKTRKAAMKPTTKWAIYFDLERKVLNAVREYLEQTNNAHFLEHDGWTTAKAIDQAALQSYIEQKTGFVVKFSYEEVTAQ